MPDGDIVHNGLRRLYQKPYKWLCEGKATHEECARVLLEKLKQDLKAKGDLPVILAQNIASQLSNAISSVNELKPNEYATLSSEFDKLIQQSNGRHDIKELVRRSVKGVLHNIRYGQEVNINNVEVFILERYINEVYEASFKERIPLTHKHYADIDEETLLYRIKEIQPNMKSGISKFAQDAIKHRTLNKLSLPRRSSIKEIDLDEDLLAG